VLAIAVGDEFHNADDDQGPDDYGPEHEQGCVTHGSALKPVHDAV
jgi:hypothetical protein